MELRPYEEGDLWLARALESDPQVMRDLGGPTLPEKILQHHHRRSKNVRDVDVWYFTVLAEDRSPAGTIGIWASEVSGSSIYEAGWMVLPAYQGRGLATAAGRELLRRARQARQFKTIHAFPSASNAASNAVCRKLGFVLAGEAFFSYNGPPQKLNDWKIDL